uniref:DUF3846 domain-containing protein n=1 Tax=Strongyloides venezuelensis TaxID=75913 RepID=A0A0K0G342_STRVS
MVIVVYKYSFSIVEGSYFQTLSSSTMISALVFEEGIDIHAAPQDYVVEDVIRQLKSYGVKFAKTSGETCDIFEQAFDQCMGRGCIVNALGLCDSEVVFVVRQPEYSTDIVYLDDNEVLATDLRRFLPSNEYDVDQTTNDTSRLNVNDNNGFSGDVEGSGNWNSDGPQRDDPVERTDEGSGGQQPEEPRDQQPEEPRDQQPEEPRDQQPEEPRDEQPEAPRDEQPEEPSDQQPQEPTEEPSEEPKGEPNNRQEDIPDPPRDN